MERFAAERSFPFRPVLENFACDKVAPIRFVPVRSCLERSTLERFAAERSFPFRSVLERSLPVKFTLCRSVLSSKFELSKFAKANLAPSIFAFLKLVLLKSALSKTAFCRFKLSKFLPDKFAATAYTTPVIGS